MKLEPIGSLKRSLKRVETTLLKLVEGFFSRYETQNELFKSLTDC